MQTPPGWRQTLTSCWVFPAIIAWKIVLMGAWALPPPANDAFFYDGAVVNWLGQGDYVNPSLARALPISGTVVFSAYPPGYEAVLAVWMAIFGPSGQSAQGLHVGLFAVFAGSDEYRQLRARAVPLFVPPGHFYSPVTDPEALRREAGRIFGRAEAPAGVDLRAAAQLDYAGAVDRFKAAQALPGAQRAADPMELAIVDSRLRQAQALLRESVLDE